MNVEGKKRKKMGFCYGMGEGDMRDSDGTWREKKRDGVLGAKP